MIKRILYVILLVSNISLAQNFNWITPNKPYLKLYVIDDGIYRINKIDFINAGVQTSSIDPRTVKVFFKGNQIPIYFFGETDGIFNDNDYFDFYGTRNYGGQTISYKEINGINVTDYVTDEYFNQYSDTSVYWVDWGGTFGLRFTDYNYTNNILYPLSYFNTNIHFEKDLVFSLGEHRNDFDYRNFNNEKISGEGWFWKEFQRGNSISDTFRTPCLSSISQTCLLKLFAYPNSYSDQIYNEHRLLIRINGTLLDTILTDNYRKIDTTIGFTSSLLSNSNLNQISVTYTGTGNYVGRMFFDYFELKYPRKFDFENNKLSFNLNLNDSTTRIFKIKNYQSSNETNIYDVKNNLKISNFTQSSDTLIFTGKQNGNFEIINSYITKKPFRIKQKQVPNLASNSNGADHLIIYNRLFESAAEQLRQYRTSNDNFRSVKAEIEDIYDIFNFGMEDPIAVRNFTKYVFTNWQLPKLKFIVLFGRGSLDPKRNSTSSIYYQNYIPVYGNPTTDGYFANFNFGTFTYYDQVAIGRIPIISSSEANDVVNKIIQYENQKLNPESWFKKFIFITGGQNISEQIQFGLQSDGFINQYIIPKPTCGYPIRIYRNDSTGYVTFNYQDSIKNAINNGGLITNYIGHAGSNVWDNGINGPEILSNQNKLSFVLSMTCFTGKNAESGFRSFGENFINIANKGAIGFVGTTGWSFSNTGNTYNDYLFNSFSLDTTRRIGLIVQKASMRMGGDSTNSASRNTLNCYGLLGDPATTLLMPKYPEFAINNSDYKLSNPFPSVKENIILSIFPQNLGIGADSSKIRFQLFKNNIINRTKDTIIYNFGFIDTIKYNFSLDSAGNYTMKIFLDPDNWNTKELKTNNNIWFPITLKNISFVPLKPLDNQVIGDTVEIVGINPNVNLISNNLKLLLQIDTSKNFNSPISQTYFNNTPQGVVTKFKYIIPIKDTNVVYFYRLNSIINSSDTSGWSEVRRFLIQNSNNQEFYKSTKSDQNVTIYKKNIKQYNDIDLVNITGSTDSLSIKKYTGNIFAQSLGNNSFDMSYINIDNIEYKFIDSAFWGGLNLIKLNKFNSNIIQIKHFSFATNFANDSVISFLNTFDEKNILIVLKSSPNNTNFGINSSLKAKFRFFGSNFVDSVSLQSFSCWSFISYNTLPNPVVAENFNFSFSPAVSIMHPLFYYDSAFVITTFENAKHWGNLNLSIMIPPFTNILSDVYSINHDGISFPILNNISNLNNYNFDTLNTYKNPNLKIASKLYLDFTNGIQSPVFNNLKFTYAPACEFIVDNNSLIKSDSILQEGDSISISLKLYNYGFSDIAGFVNKWTATSPNGLVLLKIDSVNSVLKIDSSYTINSKFSTNGLRNQQRRIDTITIFYEGILTNQQNEFFSYNNFAATRFILTGDSLKPILDITYDGNVAQSGDFISANPKIEMKFYDDSKLFIKDTSNVRIKIDSNFVWYYINGVKNPDIDIHFFNDKYIQAILNFNPKLKEGDHEFQYFAFDRNGNYSDTITHYLTVNPELTIMDLNNYPNPMKNETTFLINISGSVPPTNSKLKLFTVAGRLIKTIEIPLKVGYNQVLWNGRDGDGDYVANGVYLYKLIIEGNNKIDSKLQKLVVLK